MSEETLEFTANGSSVFVSRAIEQYATDQGRLSALVVPWESDRGALSMAVTAVKSDGWAIEHTNLGTIRLTELGNNLTRVAISAHQPDHADKKKLAVLFDAFARQIQSKLQIATPA
jgi:hypothetical protein